MAVTPRGDGQVSRMACGRESADTFLKGILYVFRSNVSLPVMYVRVPALVVPLSQVALILRHVVGRMRG